MGSVKYRQRHCFGRHTVSGWVDWHGWVQRQSGFGGRGPWSVADLMDSWTVGMVGGLQGLGGLASCGWVQ